MGACPSCIQGVVPIRTLVPLSTFGSGSLLANTSNLVLTPRRKTWSLKPATRIPCTQWTFGCTITGPRKWLARHAAQILNNVGANLKTADRIYDKTECTPADVSSISHRPTGLDGGEYACWDDSFHNSKYFQNCHVDEIVAKDTLDAGGGEEVAPLPTSSPTKKLVPVVSVPVIEAVEPPIEETSPDSVTSIDVAETPEPEEATVGTTIPAEDTSVADVDNSANQFSLIETAGIASAVAMMALL